MPSSSLVCFWPENIKQDCGGFKPPLYDTWKNSEQAVVDQKLGATYALSSFEAPGSNGTSLMSQFFHNKETPNLQS